MMKARGLRNNNPLNIRIGNTWIGEKMPNTDGAFEQFITMEMGLRAGFVLLERYIRKYGRNTVRKIISAWAPSNENNTRAYIAQVVKVSGLGADEVIAHDNYDQMSRLVDAMIKVECGTHIPPETIKGGWEMRRKV